MTRVGFVLCLALGLAGCGAASGRVPVSGTVTLDSQPLADALVAFYPGEGTAGLGGHGRTGADGKYTLTPSRGSGGLDPGAYTVTVSLLLRPDGTPLPVGTPPIGADATERLPPIYSSRTDTTLKANVTRETMTYDFALRKKP
jgi:hypothetical protein